MKSVTQKFDTTVGQMTEMSQWPKCLSKEMTEMSQRKKRDSDAYVASHIFHYIVIFELITRIV